MVEPIVKDDKLNHDYEKITFYTAQIVAEP